MTLVGMRPGTRPSEESQNISETKSQQYMDVSENREGWKQKVENLFKELLDKQVSLAPTPVSL